MMTGLLLIFAAMLIIQIAFLVFQAAGGKLVGAEIEEIGIFTGPALFSFDCAGIKFRVNYLPFGCYVKFLEGFDRLAAWRKISVVLAGVVSYPGVGFIGLGFDQTIHHILTGFRQIFEVLLAPLAVGSRLIEFLAIVFREKSFLSGIGILAGKYFAFNLLPIGSLAGGFLVIYLLELCGFKSDKFNERFQLVGFFLLLGLMAPWLIAFIGFVWKNFAL